MAPSEFQLHADTARQDTLLDKLGFSGLAQHIARGICEMTPIEGITVGVLGSWGSGKTTMINFVRHYVRNIEPRIQQIEFNPWWFLGSEDLIRNLLLEFAAFCKKDEPRLTTMLCDYANVLERVPLELKPGAGGVSLDVKKAATDYAKGVREGKTVQSFKKKIREALLNSQKKYLVVIDDVDRLAVEEIRALFRAIKAIADLPNVVYLVALDQAVVAASLEDHFPGRGDDYLKKIIQAPFHLPATSTEGISKIFVDGLTVILDKHKTSIFDADRFWTLYRRGIRHLIQTPRDAVRLLNVLAVTLPAVVEEVNIPDFIALESIRLYRSSLYERIRSNKEMFAGHASDAAIRNRTNAELTAFHSDTVQGSQESWQKEFLSELFPKLRKAWEGNTYSSDWLDEWRKQLRVASPEVFDVYFSFQIPVGEVPVRTVRSYLQRALDGVQVDDLRMLTQRHDKDGNSKFWSMLNKLDDFCDDHLSEISASAIIEDVLNAWNHYEQLAEDSDRSIFSVGNDYLLIQVLSKCLEKCSLDDQKRLLSQAISSQSNPIILMRLFATIGRSYGKFSGGPKHLDQAIMPVAEYDSLTRSFCAVLQERADRQQVYQHRVWSHAITFISEILPEALPAFLMSLKRFTVGLVGIAASKSVENITLTGQSQDRRFEFDFEKTSKLMNLDRLASALRDRLTELSDTDDLELATCFIEAFERAKNNAPLDAPPSLPASASE